MESVEEKFKHIGLYLEGARLSNKDMSSFSEDFDLEQELASNPEGLILACAFSFNNVAFSDRVLYPDQYSDDALFKSIVPTETEMLLDKLKKMGDDESILDVLGGIDEFE